ncbi:DNA polymerase III subunit gamma/tau [Patescibacteria group bacterium]|nr:DNA polymerase III subunit gamma/tau [Patescibacteria group bacterium]
MSWQRIYRPKTIQGLHLTNVRETLQQLMDKGQIPQVLLFAGPKGTGKTSLARIIGAMLNDPANEKVVDYQFFNGSKPKNNKYVEPDFELNFNDRIYRGKSFIVQEMDAASNRGIDDIRELKERVALPPQDGKMTVYILDEAHMLTSAAFNALLKLLEEPPVHAVFILATTEFHKIPETIKSRCSVIHFRKADHEELKQALRGVLEAEKISFQEEALDLISERADGSFRDAVKMLEMVATDGQVNLETVESILSSSVSHDVTQLLTNVLDKDEKAIAQLFEDLRSRNIDEEFFFKSLLNYLHLCLLQNLGIKTGKPFTSQKISHFLLKELSRVEFLISPIAHLPLELKILELINRASSGSKGGGNIEPKTKTSQSSPVENKSSSVLTGDSQKLIKNWSQLLAAVKLRNITLEALLRSAKPLKGINGTAQVRVFYKFHKEQLENAKFKALISECAIPIAGGVVEIEYELSQPPQSAELKESNEIQDLVALAEEVLI